jgi:hypothetical protein
MRFLWLLALSLALAQGVPTTSNPYLKGVGYVEAMLFPNVRALAWELPYVYCLEVLKAIDDGRIAKEEALERVERLHTARFPSGVYLATPMGTALQACLTVAGSLSELTRDAFEGGTKSRYLKAFLPTLRPTLVVPAQVRRPEDIRGWRVRLVLQDGGGKELAALGHHDFIPLIYAKGGQWVGRVAYYFWAPPNEWVGFAIQGPGSMEAGERFLKAVSQAHQVAFMVERGKRETYVVSPKRFPNLW